MDRRYETSEDANMRLAKTIVRLDGEPAFVHGVVAGLDLTLLKILPNEAVVVDANSDRIDISSPPLGYATFGDNELAYVSRYTTRQQKQGVELRSLRVDWVGHPNSQGLGNEQLKNLAKTIQGDFPSFDTARQTVRYFRRKAGGCHFDRYLALLKTPDPSVMRIRHLLSDVGLYIHSEGVGVLSKTYDEPRMRDRLSKYMEVV